MLKNQYLVAKIGLDTDENEPSKVWLFFLTKFDHSAEKYINLRYRIFQLRPGPASPLRWAAPRTSWWCSRGPRAAREAPRARRRRRPPVSTCTDPERHHSVRSSFEAGSTPIFASKYAFCSINFFKIYKKIIFSRANFANFWKKRRSTILQKHWHFFAFFGKF